MKKKLFWGILLLITFLLGIALTIGAQFAFEQGGNFITDFCRNYVS